MRRLIKQIKCIFARDDRGVWIGSNHCDNRFLSEDNTDWVAVEDSSFWYRHRNDVLLAMGERFFENRALVEVGAGNGFVAKAFQDQGFEVLAIEPTYEWAKNAKMRGVDEVVCCFFEKTGLEHGSFPNVGVFDVLEHVEDDEAFLQSIREYMCSGGYVLCSVPAYGFLWSNEDEDAGHYRRYNLSGLSLLFQKAGFDVVFSTYFFGFLVLPILALRSIPTYAGIRKRRTSERSCSEHEVNGFRGGIVSYFSRKELSALRAGRRRNFGASCLIVARKS